MRWSAILVCLLFLPAVSAETYTTEMQTLEGFEEIDINARLYTPSVTPAPAILLTHGWNDNLDSSHTVSFAQRYAEAGYVVLAYDSRGWGKSGGDVELNGPKEVKDVHALISFLATLDTVIQDGPGDPRVGMIGQSYAGGIQLLAAQADPRIDAIAPFATWSNLEEALVPGGAVKRGWVDLLFASGQFSARGFKLGETDPTKFDPNPSGPMPELTKWYAEILATNEPSEEASEALGVVRSLVPGQLTTPTFLVQGWPDTLFTPDDALATFYDLRARGVDVRIAFMHGGHGIGGYQNETVMQQVDDFFSQYLRDEMPSKAPYPVFRHRIAEQDFVGEMAWPPTGTQAGIWHFTDDGLATGAGPLDLTLTAPPVPAHCTEITNYQEMGEPICGWGMDGTYHTFATPALEAAQEVTGQGQLILPISTTQTQEVFLFFQLVDVAPDGTESTVLAQIKPFRDAASTQAASVVLPAITHTFAKGHSIGIRVSTTDLQFHGAREPGQITLSGGESSPALVVLPLTPKDAHGDRIEPTITRISSFGQAIEEDDNMTQTLTVKLEDDLAVGPYAVTGDGANVTVMVVEQTPTMRLLSIKAKADVCDMGIVDVRVEDFDGNAATRSFSVVPCPPVEPEVIDPPAPAKKSPGGWLILPLLAAALLRRRT